MIEIEIQNETHQTQQRLRFAAVPRIGEGIRLLGPDGYWASYDVLDLWYQKAQYGDVWEPYLHVRMTAGELGVAMNRAADKPDVDARNLECDRNTAIPFANRQPIAALDEMRKQEVTSFTT